MCPYPLESQRTLEPVLPTTKPCTVALTVLFFESAPGLEQYADATWERQLGCQPPPVRGLARNGSAQRVGWDERKPQCPTLYEAFCWMKRSASGWKLSEWPLVDATKRMRREGKAGAIARAALDAITRQANDASLHPREIMVP